MRFRQIFRLIGIPNFFLGLSMLARLIVSLCLAKKDLLASKQIGGIIIMLC